MQAYAVGLLFGGDAISNLYIMTPIDTVLAGLGVSCLRFGRGQDVIIGGKGDGTDATAVGD
jgi:hypothetical protein